MVEVFKTNVRTKKQATKITSLLYPMKANFDLEDCDKILRVDYEQINVEEVVRFVTAQGFTCTLLDDQINNSNQSLKKNDKEKTIVL